MPETMSGRSQGAASRIRELQARLARAEDRIKGLEDSNSWRLTAPLRQAMNWLRTKPAQPPTITGEARILPPTITGEARILPEICEDFRSLAEWQRWSERNPDFLAPSLAVAIVEEVLRAGLETPLFGESLPEEVTYGGTEPREELVARSLSGRLRAVLRVLALDGRAADTRNTRIYMHEALTRFALHLRGRYPNCVGSEFAPEAEAAAMLWPVPAVDITLSPFNEAAFDFVLTNEVLEHVADLPAALRDTARILKPSGKLIGTFPFHWTLHDTVIRARLTPQGVEHLLPPEYHGNPLDPAGSLAFQIPGWDILDACREAGFSDAKMMYLISPRFGIAARHIPGIFVLCAQR